jgi:hypothetical protein
MRWLLFEFVPKLVHIEAKVRHSRTRWIAPDFFHDLAVSHHISGMTDEHAEKGVLKGR